MTAPIERIRNLMALAEQDNEEGRTSAHLALKLIKKHGFVITVASRDDETPPKRQDRPRPSPTPSGAGASAAGASAAGASTRWRGALDIVTDEVSKFFQAIDVLPRDIPVTGVQLAPAPHPGQCKCGHRYRMGELVSRGRPFRCARCVSMRL